MYSDLSPYGKAEAITPNDSTDIELTRGLYVGQAGSLKVDMADGSTVVFDEAYIGYHPLQVTRVYATGTGAANIVALR